MQEPEIQTYPLSTLGDSLLLCTDGFWEQLNEKEILAIQSGQQLKEIILKGNNTDDSIVILAINSN